MPPLSAKRCCSSRRYRHARRATRVRSTLARRMWTSTTRSSRAPSVASAALKVVRSPALQTATASAARTAAPAAGACIMCGLQLTSAEKKWKTDCARLPGKRLQPSATTLWNALDLGGERLAPQAAPPTSSAVVGSRICYVHLGRERTTRFVSVRDRTLRNAAAAEEPGAAGGRAGLGKFFALPYDPRPSIRPLVDVVRARRAGVARRAVGVEHHRPQLRALVPWTTPVTPAPRSPSCAGVYSSRRRAAAHPRGASSSCPFSCFLAAEESGGFGG